MYCSETKKPEVFKQKVLNGKVASVTAFLRISQAIWKLGTVLVGLMWSSYFDDFYSVEEVSLSRHTDMVISTLFGILGWKLSDKLIDYMGPCAKSWEWSLTCAWPVKVCLLFAKLTSELLSSVNNLTTSFPVFNSESQMVND